MINYFSNNLHLLKHMACIYTYIMHTYIHTIHRYTRICISCNKFINFCEINDYLMCKHQTQLYKIYILAFMDAVNSVKRHLDNELLKMTMNGITSDIINKRDQQNNFVIFYDLL